MEDMLEEFVWFLFMLIAVYQHRGMDNRCGAERGCLFVTEENDQFIPSMPNLVQIGPPDLGPKVNPPTQSENLHIP
jgi:hypothetical protein